jgi:hypothetical protein
MNVMSKPGRTHLVKDSLGWGLALWFVGYVLGIVGFLVLPPALIGWAVMPVGIALTLWVLLTRVRATRLRHDLMVALAWTAIAVVGDYLFIVKAFNPPDGYYKLDVYLYYAVTGMMPLSVGWWRASRSHES